MKDERRKMSTQKEILIKISNQLNGINEIKEEIDNLRSSVTYLMNRMNFVEETITKFYKERKELENKIMKRDQFIIDQIIDLNEVAAKIKSGNNGTGKKNKRTAKAS